MKNGLKNFFYIHWVEKRDQKGKRGAKGVGELTIEG